ncbi:MAG: DHH family phosphoesterase [Deltaproteobacteria bacterium]|nr:DHH family phosphoesterase [Deltaproteobacteria bacterium]
MSPLDVQDVQRLRQALQAAGRVLLTGPVDIDGDSVGACLALARLVEALGPARVDVAGLPGGRYADLPGADRMLDPIAVAASYDVAVVLDGDCRRLAPGVQSAWSACPFRVVVDHHQSTTPDGYELALINHEAGSTCQMVEELRRAWGLPMDPVFARLVYVGIVYDTGGFCHANTNAETFRLAADLLEQGVDHTAIVVRTIWERRRQGVLLLGRVLEGASWHAGGRLVVGTLSVELMEEIGAELMDLDRIVDVLLYVEGVQVAVLAVERRRNAGREVKLSLRSRGEVDVCQLAWRLDENGGGHRRAAGVVLPGRLQDVVGGLTPVLEDAVVCALANP